MRAASIAAVVLHLAACSSGRGGAASASAGNGGAGGASAAEGAGAPGSGGAGGAAIGNDLEDATWERLRGEFSTAPPEGVGPMPPKRMLGCAVDLPELAGRAIYVERIDVGSGQTDRQFILVAEQTSPTSILANGVAHLHRPVDPAAWRGLCDGSSTSPPGPVEPACDLRAQLALDAQSPLMFGGSQVPPSCLGVDGSDLVDLSMTVFVGWLQWHDTAPDGAGDGVTYELVRSDDCHGPGR